MHSPIARLLILGSTVVLAKAYESGITPGRAVARHEVRCGAGRAWRLQRRAVECDAGATREAEEDGLAGALTRSEVRLPLEALSESSEE